jgi:hypothetical protein
MLFWFLGMIPFMTSAASDALFIAVNDELLELSVETAPIRIGGITYLPCTIFEKSVTRVDLGVYYSWNAKEQKITLFSKGRTLEFDIKAGTAYSYIEDQEYAYQAVVRNGMPYVPAAASCGYFGLGCSLLFTDDTQFQLLRIKNGNQVLDDSMFIRSARPLLEELAGKQSSSGTSNKPGGSTVNNSGTSGNGIGQGTMVYFAIRADGGDNLNSIQNAMKGSRQVKGIFFFSVEKLASNDDTLRELVMSGQRVGLIAKGGTLEEQLGNLQEGNRLLKHILRQKAVFVLDEGMSAEIQEGLKAKGYLPWKANITVSSRGRSDTALYQTVLDRIGDSKGKARVLLDDNAKGGTISSILRQLREDRYDIRILRETDF